MIQQREDKFFPVPGEVARWVSETRTEQPRALPEPDSSYDTMSQDTRLRLAFYKILWDRRAKSSAPIPDPTEFEIRQFIDEHRHLSPERQKRGGDMVTSRDIVNKIMGGE